MFLLVGQPTFNIAQTHLTRGLSKLSSIQLTFEKIKFSQPNPIQTFGEPLVQTLELILTYLAIWSYHYIVILSYHHIIIFIKFKNLKIIKSYIINL